MHLQNGDSSTSGGRASSPHCHRARCCRRSYPSGQWL